MNRRLVTVFSFAMSLVTARAELSPPPALDGLVERPNLWTLGPAEVEAEGKPMGFEWTSSAREGMRSVARGLIFGGRPVNEALIRLRDGRVSGVTVIFFNRGDAGDLKESEFEELLVGVREAVSARTGGRPVERGKDASSAVRAEGLVWDTPTSRYLLEWSATRASRTKMIPFRAEFVRLTLTPPGEEERAIGARSASSGARQAVKAFVGRDHVVRVGGDVKLADVPMVDQGQKGYCVVASVERVMRYYGAEVDQHELAQIANSDASRGTSMEAMVDSLKRLTSRLGVKAKALYEWDISDFLKMVDDYNRAAKRAKVPPVELGGRLIDADAVFAQMKPEIFREVRLKKSSDFGKFQRDIQRSIDEGLPLLWSVRLGLVKEKEIPQAFGGHMRLITGYSAGAKEIIYSDSWGMGHEEKRMAVEDAWTITSGLTSLQPIGS